MMTTGNEIKRYFLHRLKKKTAWTQTHVIKKLFSLIIHPNRTLEAVSSNRGSL